MAAATALCLPRSTSYQMNLLRQFRSPVLLRVPVRRCGSAAKPTRHRRSTTAAISCSVLTASVRLRTHQRLDGECCEVLEMSRSDLPAAHVVVVPGNPGICEFYREYLAYLAQYMPSSYNLACLGFIGHGVEELHNGRLFTLQDQVDNCIAFLATLDGPVVLIGHSIGCHICLEAKAAVPDKVLGVVGLQPFLHPNSQATEQRRIALMLRVAPLCMFVAAICSLVSLLPTQLMLWVRAKIFIGAWNQSAHAADTTARYCFRYQLLRNVFHMGWTEFIDLADSRCSIQGRAPRLAPFQSELAFIYNEGDHWAPLQDKADIEAVLPDVATYVERCNDGTVWSHDFVTTAAGSAHFARRTAEVLSQLLGPSAGIDYEIQNEEGHSYGLDSSRAVRSTDATQLVRTSPE